jgi:hypothetical protein
LNAIGFGDFGHRPGVELDVGVIHCGIEEIFVLIALVGDWGKEHDARRAFAGIIAGLEVLEIFIEVGFELLKAILAFEAFVEAEEGEDDVGFHLAQPFIGGAEVFGAMAEDDFVAGDGEVAKNQIELGISGVNQRFEIAECCMRSAMALPTRAM